MLKLFETKTIRGFLALGLTAALAPCLAIGFFVIQEFVAFRFYRIAEDNLKIESLLISYGLREWGIGVADLVRALAVSNSFKNGNISDISSTFKALNTANPNRLWRYWSASSQPKLLAYGGSINAEAKQAFEKNQPSRSYHQAAIRGFSTYEVVASKTSKQTCLNIAKPVFRASPGTFQRFVDVQSSGRLTSAILDIPVRDDVSGVIVLCLPLENLGKETGLQSLFEDRRIGLEKKDSKYLFNPKGFSSAVILVGDNGQLLFPDVGQSPDIIPTIQDLSNTSLPSLLPLAQRVIQGEQVFTRIKGGNNSYLVFTSRIDSAWSLVLLVNENSITSSLIHIRRVQIAVALLTLIALFLIVSIRAKSVSRPISAVGTALEKISISDFDISLPSSSCAELSNFLLNVQITANRLKCNLKEATTFAVTQKEINTAKAIQQDFLLASLPSSPSYDVAAFSRPALEVGADWYDMVDGDNYAIVVLADVCDKGIPSALYMSVFRSLIRSKLIDRINSLSSPAEASSAIVNAIEQTNNYMATNQNSSMMFATLFIAAINKTSGMMNFICAGHESPVLVSQSGDKLLDKVSGPAIGLFPGVSYKVYDVQLQPADALIVYSDGLIDARSPENIGWGIGRLRELLNITRISSSSKMLSIIIEHVDNHISSPDQFDDLTVMVFRWLGPKA